VCPAAQGEGDRSVESTAARTGYRRGILACMRWGIKKAVVAGSSVLVSAGVGFVTNIASDGGTWPWWTALVSLVVVAVALEVLLTAEEPGNSMPAGSAHASAPGAVANSGTISGNVTAGGSNRGA
jgi:hypothetical protein